MSITSIDTTASEPGTDTASFTIARTGDTTAPLTVQLRISGTASNGVDYATLPTSVTLPAGVPSTNIVVTPLNDSMAEPTETIIVTLAGSQQYEVREAAFVRIDLADDGDVALSAVQVAGGNVQIDFSGAAGDPTSAFTLQSSADVVSGYANESGANISQLSPGFFRVTATLNGPIRLYRLQR